MSSPAATAILRRTINATRFIYFLYQVLQLVFSPVLALYLLYRGIRDPKYYKNFPERLGLLPHSLETTGAGSIWFHAVSVGEVLSALELIRRLKTEKPWVRIYVSTATLAGRAMADQKLAGLADGVFFAPLDYRSVVQRVLRKLRPALVVIFETEIWPNLYRESKRAGASLLVVNGRISDRAFPGYRRWRGFFRHVLAQPDAILAQSEQDARRYVEAGAPANRVTFAGNLKYDFKPPASGIAPEIAKFIDDANPSAVWIAASTMPPVDASDVDEDDIVIAAYRALKRPGLMLILAPRRPERFDVVAEKLKTAGISFARRTALTGPADVLLVDSIGELAALFQRADIVFMGGTLAKRGGHNILEPAYFGKPVIVGPHMENFAEIAKDFFAANALEPIDGPEALAPAVAALLDSSRRLSLGARAKELAMAKRGAAERVAQEIWRWYARGVPNPVHSLPRRLLYTPLTWLWRSGHRINMTRSGKSLKTPVISIGALTAGGAGKSPLVAHLASKLREAGRTPAILTRGYKRRSPARELIVARGAKADAQLTGDEAQTFVRACDAHVGIGANRFHVGQRMEQDLAPDVFLLDDGFQHIGLRRRHDIVLIDAMNPLGGGPVPLGRMREPLASLGRATEIVVTRLEDGQDIAGIEGVVRRYNAKAPIFRSRVIPRQWVDLEWGTTRDLADPGFRKVAAFCGLGAPRSFWRTLEQLGLEVVSRWPFSDHHHYRAAELRRLAGHAASHGAEVLVTTEKDAMNLPADAVALAAPLKILWLKIGIEIEEEEQLLQRISL